MAEKSIANVLNSLFGRLVEILLEWKIVSCMFDEEEKKVASDSGSSLALLLTADILSTVSMLVRYYHVLNAGPMWKSLIQYWCGEAGLNVD